MKSLTKAKDQARKHEQKEEWQKAIDAYLQVLETGHEGDAEIELPLYNRVGDLYVRLGRPEDAVRYYEQAADQYAEAGLFNNAIALCNKALRYVPGRVDVLRKLGEFSASQGFLTDARRWFLEYAEKMSRVGRVDAAFEALGRFADTSEDPAIRELLADRLQAHDRVPQAVAELRRAFGMRAAAGEREAADALKARILELDPDADVSAEGAAAGLSHAGPASHPLPGLADAAPPAAEAPPAGDPEPAAEAAPESAWDTASAPAEESTPEFAWDRDPEPAAESPSEPSAGLEGPEEERYAAEEALDIEPTAFGGGFDDHDEGLDELTLEGFESTQIEPDGVDEVESTELSGLEGFEGAARSGAAEVAGGVVDEDVDIAAPELDEAAGWLDVDAIDEEAAQADLTDEEEPAALPMLEEHEDEWEEADGQALPLLDDHAGEMAPLPGLDEAVSRESGEESPDPSGVESGPDVDPSAAAEYEPPAAEPVDVAVERERAADLLATGQAEEAGYVLRELHATLAGAGRHAEALAVLEELIGFEPDELEHHWRAVEYAGAVGETEARVRTRLGLAAGLQRSGAAAEALAMYRQVLDLEPDNPIAGQALATEPVQADEGFVDLFALVAGDEEDPDTRFVVAENAPSGDEDRDFADLLAQFKRKVYENVGPEDAGSHYDLGLAFKEMGLVDEAIAEFQVALRGGAESLKIYEELSQCFILKEQHSIALKVLQRALQLPYEDEVELIAVLYHMGRVQEALGAAAEAREAYERVLGLDVNFADVNERLARL